MVLPGKRDRLIWDQQLKIRVFPDPLLGSEEQCSPITSENWPVRDSSQCRLSHKKNITKNEIKITTVKWPYKQRKKSKNLSERRE